MKEEKKPLLTKGTLILRTVVALYLLYTVYQLVPSLKTSTGRDLIFVVAAMVIFTAIAIPLAIFSAKALIKGEFADPMSGKTQDNPEEEQEQIEQSTDSPENGIEEVENASEHKDEQDTAE